MAITVEMRTQVSQLYVALFGRAPDGEGLGYWVNELSSGKTVVEVANAMYDTAPARDFYPSFLTNQEIIASFYVNVLGRPADAEGLAYWTAKLNAAGATPGSVIAEMIDVVANYDGTDPDGLESAALFENKVTVAQWYGEENGSIEGAAVVLDGVTADPATAEAVIEGGVAASGETFTLTTSVDNLAVTTANTIDTVKGIVDGDADADTAKSTFSVGDSITGNGKTVLELAVVEAGDADFASVSMVDKVNIVAAVTSSVTFDASDWSDVGSVNLTRGANGLDVTVNNAEAGVDASVAAGVAGTVTINSVNDDMVYVEADEDSSASIVGGVVTADVAASESVTVSYTNSVTGDIAVGNVTAAVADSGWFYANFETTKGDVTVGDVAVTVGESGSAEVSVTAAGDAMDLTIGNVTMTGASAESASLWAYQGDKGGNVVVGDITMTGFTDIEFGVYNWNNDDAEAGASNTTVGDITISLDKSGSFDGSVTNENQGATGGNLVVGDISITEAAAGEGWMYLYNEGDSTTVASDAGIGSTTIGAIDVTLATDATLEISVSVDASAGAAKKAVVGDVTIGAINAELGINTSFTLDVGVYADGNNNGDVIGNLTVGDITASLDDGAYMSVSLSAWADDGKLSDVTVGNITVTGGVSSEIDLWNYYNAETDGVGTVVASIGDITYGDIDVTVGKNGSASFSLTASASNDSVGMVTFGDVTLNVGESGYADYLFEIDADKAIAGFEMGDVTIVAGKSASVDSFEISLSADDGIGSITIGNIDVSVGENANVESVDMYVSNTDNSIGSLTIGNINVDLAKGGYFSGDWTFSGDYGTDLGAVIIGDITMTGAKSASADFTFELYEFNDIDSVNVGNVTLAAIGDNADLWGSFTVDASGDVGTMTFGDISLTANGKDAYAGYEITADYMDNPNGGIVVGDVTLSADVALYEDTAHAAQTSDVAVTATVSLSVYNYEGSVTVGNINLSTTSTGSATNDSYVYADVDLYADQTTGSADVTIGDITVSGGDGIVDNFATLTGWLSVTADGDINVGTIDYSGYGADADIDVSGFDSVTAVIGSDNDDTITDGALVSTYTGGAGADTFDFSTGNTGLTEATIDTVTDFNAAEGDLLDLGVTPIQSTYSEATFADFAAFVTGANAANKEVFVGQVGADSFVAVDAANDGTVDFMIKLVGVTLSEIDLASYA